MPNHARAHLRTLPALVLWGGCENLAATLLPSKSLDSNTYAVDWPTTVIDHDWGLAGEEVTLKGDGEPALRALCKAIAEARRCRTILEVSPPEDHQGHAEALRWLGCPPPRFFSRTTFYFYRLIMGHGSQVW